MSTRRKRLLGFALGTLALLFVLPTTGWLVRVQFASLWGPWAAPSPYSGPEREKRESAVAKISPTDFPIQLAFALSQTATEKTEQTERQSGSWGVSRVASLRALVARYNNEPSLHASRLRYLAWGLVKAERADENLLSIEPVRESPKKAENPAVNAPAVLAEYDAAAQAGEHLDPGNAYFPFMRAVGLYAAHRDADGDAALLRAGAKSQCNDYSTDEVLGRWRLQEKSSGESGTIARTAVAAGLMFPHYARLRAVARIGTVRAMRFETTGQTERGFALRHALTRCGALMRVQSQTLIGSLVGSAITQLAARRPGGAPVVRSPGEDNRTFGEGKGKERAKAEQDAYCVYLTKIGHADEVQVFRFETAALDQYKAIYKKADGKLPMDQGTILPLVAGWSAGMLTLTAMLLTALFGGIAALLARTARIQKGKPLYPAIFTGLCLAVVMPFAACGAVGYTQDNVALGLTVLGLSLLAGVFSFALCRFRRSTVRESLQNTGYFVATLVGSLSIAFIATLCCVGPVSWVCGSLTAVSPALRDMTGPQANLALACVASFLVLIAITPITFVVLLAVGSRKVGVPFSVGLVRGIRGLAVPIASCLLLAYGGITLATVRAEQQATQALRQSVAHEGRYMAKVVGTEWPGLGPSAQP